MSIPVGMGSCSLSSAWDSSGQVPNEAVALRVALSIGCSSWRNMLWNMVNGSYPRGQELLWLVAGYTVSYPTRYLWGDPDPDICFGIQLKHRYSGGPVWIPIGILLFPLKPCIVILATSLFVRLCPWGTSTEKQRNVICKPQKPEENWVWISLFYPFSMRLQFVI